MESKRLMTHSATFRYATSQGGTRMISAATHTLWWQEPRWLMTATEIRELSKHTHGIAWPKPVQTRNRNSQNGCRMLNILQTAYSELLVISHHCPRTFLFVNEMVFLYHLVFLYHSGGFIPFLVFLPCGYTRVFVPSFMLRHCFQTGVRCILGPISSHDIPWYLQYSRYQCVPGTGAIYHESPWQSVDVEGEDEFQRAKGNITVEGLWGSLFCWMGGLW